MIKIFHVIPSIGIGGAEKFVLDLSSNIDSNKFKVYVVSLYDNDEFQFDKKNYKNINFVFLGKRRGFDFKTMIKFSKLLKKIKPDVVNTHTYVDTYTIIPCLLNRIKFRCHTVHSIAEYELNKKLQKIMYIAYHFFKVIPIAISPTVKKTIEERYKLKDIPCIYNGIDTKIFKKTLKQETDSNQKFITVARLTDVKNHELMIYSFKEALKKNKDLSLKIVGDGELKDHLECIIKEENLENNIQLVGARHDIPFQLSQSDIFILTSKFEGLPISILEAMSCGLPIISTDVGGVGDIVIDGYNGFLVNQNTKEISETIVKISSNKKLASYLSKNSYECSSKYDIKLTAKEYEKLYEQRIK